MQFPSFPSRAASALVFLAVAAASPAQSRSSVATPAPQAVREAFGLRAATVQDLALPERGRAALQLQVVLAGQPVRIDLVPNDVRSRGFALYEWNERGLRRLPTPVSTTYRGSVRGHAGSDVAASLIDGALTVYAHVDGVTWGIQPLSSAFPEQPATRHVVYRDADVRSPGGVRCGVHDVAAARKPGRVAGPQAVMKEADIAIDIDFEFFKKNGSNVVRAQNAVTAILNSVNTIYTRDVQIRYRVTAVVVRTKKLYPNLSPSALLSRFQAVWNVAHRNVDRDLAHLFTGQGTFSGTIGIATIGSVCDKTRAYGLSKAFHASSTKNIALVAHEIGHNWNARHCDSSPACNIMCASNGGCSGNQTSFGPIAKAQILLFKGTRNCLNDIVRATYNFFGTNCSGTGACAYSNYWGGNLSNFRLRDEYCYPVRASRKTTIVGAQLFTKSATGRAHTVVVGLYKATKAGVPSTTPVALGNLNIGAGAKFYTVWFNTRVAMAAGETFWVSQRDTFNVHPADLTSGSGPNGKIFRRSPARGPWQTNFLLKHPSLHALCARTGVPRLGASPTPVLGRRVILFINGGLPLAPAFMLFGSSPTSIGLGRFGAPGCSLFTNSQATVPLLLNASGSANMQITIPNSSSLIRGQFVNQGLILDRAANALGLVVTQGGLATMGNQ